MFSPEQFAKYRELFQGREDAYAQGFLDPNKSSTKYRYYLVNAPLTDVVIQEHLNGDKVRGLYCEREGLCRWGALDFDAPKGADDKPVEGGYELAYNEARRFQDIARREGLFSHLERSRSGNGVHCWLFFDAWTDARHLASVLESLWRPQNFTTVDRGKVYPPRVASNNSILICFPYSGEAVERGNSMFLDETGAELTMAEFLDTVRVNSTAALTRILPLPEEVAPGAAAASGTRLAPIRLGEDGGGRPKVLGTGIIKMLSPFGCNFMRQVWLQQHDNAVVGENEWYAFLGQLTAFKHGRDAAHSIFRDHKYYSPRGMDEKYDHAAASPPVGCAFIHREFPQFKCAGCPMTAPYHKGYQSIQKLCGESPQELERAKFTLDLERIQRLDASANPEGVSLGIPGIDHLVRAKASDFIGFGALPSIGKSAMGVHIANTVAPQGVDVSFFSAESGPVSIHDRQIAHRSGVDSYALKGLRMEDGVKKKLTRDEWKRIEEAVDWLDKQPIWENYTTSSPERIYDAIESMLCKRRKSLLAPALVLFDYFQYAQGNDTGRTQEEHERLAKASHALKCVTKLVEHPLLVFAQLKRESEGEDTPELNWWRGTARLEHDIDTGLIMTGTRIPGQYAPRVIHCVKQREGQVQWKQELLLEQANSRFVGPPNEPAQREQLHDPPWEGAAGQFSMGSKP